MSVQHPLRRQRQCNGAAPSTVDALIHELRTCGVAALAGPNCRRRLAELSTAQTREMIGRLMALRSKYPAITDELLMRVGALL
jgi:hypothetical protein